MQLVLENKPFREAVQQANRVINPNNPAVVLQHLKIEAGDSILLTATDYEQELQLLIPGEVKRSGSVLLPAKALAQMTAALPGESFKLESKDGTLAHLNSGGSRYKLNGYNAGAFPEFRLGEPELCLEFKQWQIKEAVEKTAYCIGDGEHRPVMGGAILDYHDEFLSFVTTNNHCLALYWISSGGDPFAGVQKKVCLPKAFYLTLGRLLNDSEESVWLEIGSETVTVTTRWFRFATYLIAGQLPEWRRVTFRERPVTVTVERKTLVEALKRMSAVLDLELPRINLSVTNGTLRLQGQHAGVGEGEESISVEGGDIELFLYQDQLLAALSVLDEEQAVLEFESPDKPLVVTSTADRATGVIMPVSPW